MKAVSLRFSTVFDNFAGGKAQGIFAKDIDRLLIEYSFLDGNGWNRHLPRDDAKQTDYYGQSRSHNLYATGGCGPVIVRDSILSRAASHAIHGRSGGLVERCLFVNDPIGVQMVYTPDDRPGIGEIRDCVFIGGADIYGSPRGIAIWAENVDQLTIKRCRFASLTYHRPSLSAVRVNHESGRIGTIVMEDCEAFGYERPIHHVEGTSKTIQRRCNLRLSIDQVRDIEALKEYENGKRLSDMRPILANQKQAVDDGDDIGCTRRAVTPCSKILTECCVGLRGNTCLTHRLEPRRDSLRSWPDGSGENIEPGPERTVALRKLLEAKDAAVRATIDQGG